MDADKQFLARTDKGGISGSWVNSRAADKTSQILTWSINPLAFRRGGGWQPLDFLHWDALLSQLRLKYLSKNLWNIEPPQVFGGVFGFK